MINIIGTLFSLYLLFFFNLLGLKKNNFFINSEYFLVIIKNNSLYE